MNSMKKYLFVLLLLGCLATLHARSGWKAHWINTEECQSATNTWLAFRKTVNLESVPQSLSAKIAVDSKYWLWINGKLVVFEGGLKRGPSPVGIYYDTIDIAPYLSNGQNVIALLVWHFGKNGFSHANSGTAALLFEAIAPGIEIISDRSWDCALYKAYQNTEEPFPNFRLPESNIRFDARNEIAGWNQLGFKGKLPQATIVSEAEAAPFGELVERPIPQWKDYGLKPYVTTRKSVKGDTLFCQLPYNCQVTPYLKVRAKAGKTIHILTDNYQGGSANNVRAEYITKDGIQEYENYGWMNGHHVLYVIPEGVNVIDLKFRETGYDAEFTGNFHCNDSFLNELWKRSARTLYVTMRDSYMDCPDRERAQWWGDEVNELGESFYALSPSSHKLAVKGIYELMNWQRPDGVIFSPAPAGNYRAELPLQMLASVGWYGFHTQYYYSGDSSFVSKVYDRVHHYLHKVWKTAPDGLAISRAGDWSWGDWGDNIDMEVLTNCWYYLALKAERAFALQLGKTSDAEQDARMMEAIEKNFDKAFWNGTAYRSPQYRGETDDRAQAMAIVSGLASKDKYKALAQVLEKERHASPYMEKYVLEALFVMDEPVLAMERMKGRYKKMIDSYPHYTTLFEGWGIGDDGFGGGTINHAWSGGPLTILSQKVCGIAPTSPGFKTFQVRPQMGNLREASATIDTNYGKISVELMRNGSKITMNLSVPSGTKAEIYLSKRKTKTLESGNHTLSISANTF